MRHLELLCSTEQFDGQNVDFFQVDAAHAEDFLADVVGFLVHSRNLDYLIWGEKCEDCRCWPDTEVIKYGLFFLRSHTLDEIRLKRKNE